MGIEIERKFLVLNDEWRRGADAGRLLRQGYLASSDRATVRVRTEDQTISYVTIKGSGGVSRAEYEYDIPFGDALELLEMCGGHTLEKRRHELPAGGLTWEIDVFMGRHAGLVLAEIEMEHEDQHFERPDWLGQEVTHDSRYRNEFLARS